MEVIIMPISTLYYITKRWKWFAILITVVNTEAILTIRIKYISVVDNTSAMENNNITNKTIIATGT